MTIIKDIRITKVREKHNKTEYKIRINNYKISEIDMTIPELFESEALDLLTDFFESYNIKIYKEEMG